MNKRRISLILIIAFVVAMALTGCGEKEQVEVEEKQTSVEIDEVGRKDILVKTILSGKIRPIEEASVSPKVSGQIEKVYVDIGDYVSKGDVLFTIDSQSYRAMYNQAQASYLSAKAAYEAATQRMDNAKLNLERNEKLYEQGAISKQTYESMQLQALDSDLETRRFSMESARAAMESASISFQNSVVKAPISGRVALVDVRMGDMASPGMKGVTITDSSRVEIETSVSEHLINMISRGEQVDIRIESASKEPFKGKISAMSLSTTKDTMTYPIKIELENKEGIIKPGMFAEIEVVTKSQKNVVAVPSEAIIVKDGKTTVFVIEQDRALLREVETGLDDGSYVNVEEGLSEGESVVVKGQNYIEDGSKVKINGQEVVN